MSQAPLAQRADCHHHALSDRLAPTGQMQPPKMSLHVLAAELRERLPSVLQQPLDEPPIPPRCPLRAPPDADQKRGPSVEIVKFNFTTLPAARIFYPT